MRHNDLRVSALAACGLLALAVWGCAFAGDALNPELLAQLGFDPSTTFPSTGTVIVTFTNDTDLPAMFLAWQWISGTDPPRKRNFSVPVDAHETGNEVLDCQFRLVSLGSATTETEVSSVAAIVGATSVNYNGGALLNGQDFTCGDVISVTLSGAAGAAGAQQTGAYTLTVQILPGR